MAPAAFAVLVTLAVAAYNIDHLVGAGAPLPDSYVPTRGEDLERPSGCGPVPPDTTEWTLEDFTLFIPRAGGDTVSLGRGNHGVIFDSASPETLDSHDRLVLRDRLPAETRFVRAGPHLLVCSDYPRSEVLILRHYCAGTDGGEHWNNGIEEIKFHRAREIWLRDDLLKELLAAPNASAPASAEISDELDRIVELSLDRWTLKPLSEMLPGGWLSSIQCRLDARQRPPG